MTAWTDDYTRSRAIGTVPYTIDSIIGRSEAADKVQITEMSVSGTVVSLPTTQLARRSYIKVTNTGSEAATILATISGTVSGTGIQLASSASWEDNTAAKLYIVSTATGTTVTVYERSSR